MRSRSSEAGGSSAPTATGASPTPFAKTKLYFGFFSPLRHLFKGVCGPRHFQLVRFDERAKIVFSASCSSSKMASGVWRFGLVLALGVLVLGQEREGCDTCDLEACPRPRNCLAGLVKDRCGCCLVCGRIEGEKCDNDSLALDYKYVYGYCGENLECRLRSDLKGNDPDEAICFCKQTEILCASDGKTYSNLCQMMEEAYRHRNGLKAVSRGPCKSVPWVVSGPEPQIAVRGSNVALSCEGMGFPIPAVEWQLTRLDGVVVDLPSDDQHIAVQARGGPEKFEISAWLQILDFQDEDVGNYHCIVKNAEGDARATAHVKMEEPHKKSKKHNEVDTE